MKNLIFIILALCAAPAWPANSPMIYGSPYPILLGIGGQKFQKSDTTTTCNAASQDSLRNNADTIQWCDGTSWTSIAGAGGGGGTVSSVALTVPSFLSISGSPVTTSGTLAIGLSGTALPIANGGTAVTAVTVAPAATTFAGWDANVNLSANAFIQGFQSTAASAGTTTLTAASKQHQVFTGVTSQTVKLPVTSTLVLGQLFRIENSTNTNITVQSSGANSILVMSTGTWADFWVIDTTVTTAAGWTFDTAFSALPANRNLSNLNISAVNVALSPDTDNNRTLGNSGAKWGIAYIHSLDDSADSLGLAGQILQSLGSGGTNAFTWSGSPTLTTSLTNPLLIGGTTTTSTLTLKPTSGVGTTNADIIFKNGNNGATEVARILNSGFVGIGTATPLDVLDVATGGVLSRQGVIASGQTGSNFLGKGVFIDAPGGTLGRIQAFDFTGGTPFKLSLNDGGGVVLVGDHIHFEGTAPGLGSGAGDCGTSPSIVGNDVTGRVTVGSSTNGGICTLTFASTWTHAPICFAEDETTGVLTRATGSSTTAVVLRGVFVAADKVVYHCVGYE